MHRIVFCGRCRGMKVGWNKSYVLHCLTCKEFLSPSSKLLILIILLAIQILVLPLPATLVFSTETSQPAVVQAGIAPAIIAPAIEVLPAADPAVAVIDAFLTQYQVDEAHRGRIAESIVSSSRRHDVDPRLVASIMIVESRANPFAISHADSIGIMQIHMPTWGQTADEEGINLFKIEDNVDFGVRILKDYTRRFGLWEGVKRYKGWNPENPDSSQAVDEYVSKIQHIYSPEKQRASS